MRIPVGKGFIAAAAVAVALLPNQLHGDVGSVRLSVAATGFKNLEGQAIVAVYVSKETWLHADKAFRLQKVKLAGPSITVDFADLAPGTYGVSVIHDENGNGKLDMRYLPVPGPREGAGVSNNARKQFGPPSWDDSKFALTDKDAVIEIKIRY
jgi:uncharacterized protein (DUF2141 family)